MTIQQQIEIALGQPVSVISPLSGGCVADVYKVVLASGDQFVVKAGQTGSALALEGRMLNYLRAHTALPVPMVHHCHDTLLIMEFLPSGGALGPASQQHAADMIAALHTIPAAQFGFEYDTVIGGLHQPNAWSPNWIDFFRDQRLMFMAHAAHKANKLPLFTLTKLEKFAESLDSHLLEPAQPSLIHGDLWDGNILSSNDKITGLIDPALYFAHPEIELAFGTLFSTFGDSFFIRYQEHRPIEPDFFEERLDIYNLYPLLVHVRLFGGQYVSQVERTLKRFGY